MHVVRAGRLPGRPVIGAAALVAALLAASTGGAAEPWIIAQPVTVTEPTTRLGDIVIVTGGRLEITGVPEPGFQLTGSLLVAGSGELVVTGSAFRVMSTFHGQYFVAATEQGTITVTDSDYRVPAGVQHAIIALGDGEVRLADTDFGANQLVAAEQGRVTAERLNGDFEVILQEAATIALADIPRTSGSGGLWVWPEFPAGSVAVYTPPLPGYVSSWTFPPQGATGFGQRCTMERCLARLWPFLVRPGCDLVVRDVPADNWVVIGLHLPADAEVADLRNGDTYESHDLGLADRRLVLERTSVDTWNFYPQADARVTLRDALVGEVLATDASRVTLDRVTIDGSGGYLGVAGDAEVEARDSTFTCDVQVSGRGTASLRRCRLWPYPLDTGGSWTRFGAHDDGRLLLDASEATSRAVASGRGAIAVSGLLDPPPVAPGPGGHLELDGWAALYALDPALLPLQWRLEAVTEDLEPVLLGAGTGNVEGGALGIWSGAEAWRAWTLRIVLTDALDRTLTGLTEVPAVTRIRRRLHGE